MFRFSYYTRCLALLGMIVFVNAQAADPPRPPSLKTVAVPDPSNLAEFVSNKQKAIELGKALFWEMRVGSDGITACASCHFNAGADSRSMNQVNPDTMRVNHDGSANPDLTFDFGPNQQLMASDFPFRQLSNLLDRSSAPVFDSNDTVSSQGVFSEKFIKAESGKAADITAYLPDKDGFIIGKQNLRRVEPRNTPSVINAAFNFRNFFDGRAQHEFNGVNIWGNRDPEAKVYKAINPQQIEAVKLSIKNASLASQAVGPPISDTEMSAVDRTFPDIGHKLLSMRPLGLQQVHKSDSVLGLYSRFPGKGLTVKSYADMIKMAFQPQWWNSAKTINGAKPCHF
jgi:Di-haem cytochrome c peroxidase